MSFALPIEVTSGLSSEQCMTLWLKLQAAYDDLLITAFKMKVGPDGDWKAEYRRWYEADRAEHDRGLVQMLTELDRRLHLMNLRSSPESISK